MHCSTTFLGVPLTVTLETEPPLCDMGLTAPKVQADPDFRWSATETLLDPEAQLITWRLRRRDGAPFKLLSFGVSASVPARDLHRMFVPVLHDAIGKLDLISLPWTLRERTFTSWSFPLIAALNRADENRFCMGFMDHIHTAEASHRCYDEEAHIDLRRPFDEGPLETTQWEETLYLSRRGRHIFDEVRAFARAYDTVHQPVLCETPPAAWEPVWCSWYGIKNDVHADYILDILPTLREWGFGTVIVDAGWFRSDGFDGLLGHYFPDETKFPDLKRTVEAIQAQGLRVMLWCAPLFNLGGIADHPFVRRYRIEGDAQDPLFLCPRAREVRAYAARMVDHLMRTYGIDGLKIDFIDPRQSRASRICTAAHEHDIPDYGEAMYALLQDIHEAAKAVRPDALLEFRMNYTNLVTRSFATSHRAQDAPYDFDHIRRMCTRLKSYIINPAAGKAGNVAVHTDPAYWLPEESPENVARFMASLVTSGVPMLSMDLRALPAEHQRIVRSWLAFYRQHQDLLLFGTHRVLSADPHHSLLRLHRNSEALWGVFTKWFPGQLHVPGSGIQSIWILNGTAQQHLFTRLQGIEGAHLSARTCDRALEQKAKQKLPIENSSVLLDLEVETGGAVELRLESHQEEAENRKQVTGSRR